ncbi:hypothetical protein [Bacillus sp. T33-2]|uniref:hypothetical protein n=1 Tax=Bacillus sp. T33-2 TaxID=2054168 RepID=UPI000C760FB6|nr:hypothetical protein [Bacillus sp. T33-2]PLR95260.1 hypothetical protein CVD19_14895 [Bacillus sp. T33-2]
MEKIKSKTENYLFSTTVSEDEFLIEFFPYQTDPAPNERPLKVTKSVDELLDFLEETEKNLSE